MISVVLKANRDASAVPASAGMSNRCTAQELERAQMIKALHEPLLTEAITDLATVARWADVSTEEQHQVLMRMIQQVDIDATGVITKVVWKLL